MFSSAIQSLSQMAIQEAGVTIPQTADSFLLEDIKTQLDNMTPITIDEMHIMPEMVPVKLSRRLGKYLIEAEDLSRFMITNGLTDVQESIGYILEASDLVGQYSNVAIIIDEASILDEMDDLGYVVSDFNLQTPPKGLGLAMVGKQRDFAKIRNIANTKQLMDLLTGRYGLPLVKRNYKSVGLLNGSIHETAEDVEMKINRGDKVLHEEDPKKSNKQVGALPEEQQGNVRENYEEEEPVDESFWHPTMGEKIGSKFRRLTGQETWKDRLGHSLDRVGKTSSKLFAKKASEFDDNPRSSTAKMLAGYGKHMGLTLGAGAAMGALGHSLYKARQPKDQTTNKNPTDGSSSANAKDIHEAMTPHDHHIAWIRAVARGETDDEE